MLPADFLDDVALLRRLYTRRFAELLRETGLNQAEMDVLLFLANNPLMIPPGRLCGGGALPNPMYRPP